MIKRFCFAGLTIFLSLSSFADTSNDESRAKCANQKCSSNEAQRNVTNYIEKTRNSLDKPDEDGARWLHHTFGLQGMNYPYQPANTLIKSKYFFEVSTPEAADIGWWPNMVALYAPSSTQGAMYYYKGKKYAASVIETGRDKPIWLRFRYRFGVDMKKAYDAKNN